MVVEAVDGVVTLRGEVTDVHQAGELVASVDALPGVVADPPAVVTPSDRPDATRDSGPAFR